MRELSPMPRPLPAHVLAATDGDAEAVRNHILEAANRVIATRGLAAASTRAIADEAGLAGGTLYNYFDNQVQLLAKAIVYQAKSLTQPISEFGSRAGGHTVTENLSYFVRQATRLLDQLVPAFAATFADVDLLSAIRHELVGMDPLNDPARIVERYLLAERALGRVLPNADCRAAAALVVSLCHDDAFNRYLYGDLARRKSGRQEIALIVRSLTG
jgi:AcrR family transcriptional regulator